MTRKLIALALLAWFAPAARSQDMPLSQILIDGEGWKKVEKPLLRFTSAPVLTHSPNGSTIFRWIPASGGYIDARQTGAPESIPYVRYCPVRAGADQKPVAVTGLTTDREGRIYAATEIGVQVFDPTGRLCGVLTPAAPGLPERIAFEGDQLTLWIGDTKYTRKLNTSGVK